MSGDWRKWVVTFGGAGLIRPAPGTWGSLAAALTLGGLFAAASQIPSINGKLAWNLAAGVLLIGSSIACVRLGPWTNQAFGKKDPGPCVLDEVAGIALTALFQPIYPLWRQAWVLAAVFVAFRVFDITKPPPVRQLERLPHGWGILVDDLAAAIYANIVCQTALRFCLH